MYLDPSEDHLECQKVAAKTMSDALTRTDVVDASWGWLWLPNRNDERTVTFEVRSRTGTCDPDKPWSLFIEHIPQ